MALVDNAWYVNYGNGSSTGYYGVAQWAALTTYDCGTLIRQLAAPAVGSERVFVAIAGHVASSASEPTWVITRGGKTTDTTITWQECTGIAALNGDLSANTPAWNNASIKNSAITLGQVIQNVAGTLVLICTVAGTAGNGAEPSWAAYTTAGATTTDNTVTWVTLGPSFSAWAAPHARLANALTTNWVQAGNKVFVGDNHAETQASGTTLTGAGTLASPVLIYCVDHTAAVPPGSANLATTASITNTTSVNAPVLSGIYYIYGIIFDSGGGGATTNIIWLTGSQIKLENCALRKTGTVSSNNAILLQGNKIELVNTTMQFANTGDGLRIGGGTIIWRNTASAITGATLPTSFLSYQSLITGGSFVVTGVDLSALGSGKTIVPALSLPYLVSFIDCKLGASVTTGATPTVAGATADFIGTDSSGTNYRQERYQYQGTQTVETTIVRTGGATDGTTPISWKIVNTANSKWVLPFECLPSSIWNNTTGSNVIITIYGTTTGGGTINNDDIWFEAVYFGASGNPQGSFATSTKANNLASPSAYSSDASVWGGSGAGNGFKMTVTLSAPQPQLKGPIYVYIKAAKASATYYIDPKIVLS
jgi:hypothetical protein